MNQIAFFVSGEPKAQPRPRAFARRFGNKFQARVYDAGTAEGWKSLIAAEAKPFLPPLPMDGPIRLDATFFFRRPRAHYRSNGEVKPSAPDYHTIKPDRDNCEKALLDALTQIGMFKDDSQVCDGRIIKRYGEGPGAAIRIALIEQLEPLNAGHRD